MLIIDSKVNYCSCGRSPVENKNATGPHLSLKLITGANQPTAQVNSDDKTKVNKVYFVNDLLVRRRGAVVYPLLTKATKTIQVNLPTILVNFLIKVRTVNFYGSTQPS